MTGIRPTIDEVWSRIKAVSGKPFTTKSGLPFTFEVAGDVFRPSRTQYNLTKADFGKVLKLAPLDGPGTVNSVVRGPAYIWAVLHDPRVRQGDW